VGKFWRDLKGKKGKMEGKRKTFAKIIVMSMKLGASEPIRKYCGSRSFCFPPWTVVKVKWSV